MPRDTWAVDLSAPIVPGVGLGGLQLDLHVQHYYGLVDAYQVEQHSALHVFEARWEVFAPDGEAPAVAISADVRDGSVFKLTALNGYQGSYQGVKAGVTSGDDLRADERFQWNDKDECIEVTGVEGLAILPDMPSDWDNANEYIPSRPVEEIAVFLPDRGLYLSLNHWPPGQHWK